ncbi:MAG: arylamine N-acetyltransferase, partial [Trueperaceae bacterium]
MEVKHYLERIGYRGPVDVSARTLASLQRAHLHTVPFENLDVCLGREIVLEPAALYDKIVVRRRGGFCYELNGLFAWLLTELGFEVTLLSARVFGERGLGPEFDHLTLRVDLSEPWLVDVGFGDGFDETLQIDRIMHTPFGVSKTAADLYTQEYALLYGLKAASFRMGCITGGTAKAV